MESAETVDWQGFQKKQFSFIKKNNAFVPVYVAVKSISGEWIDIGNSIDMTQDVAVNAWFLVDSESFINVQSINTQ